MFVFKTQNNLLLVKYGMGFEVKSRLLFSSHLSIVFNPSMQLTRYLDELEIV